jgi:uncharacterized cupin superfamily protein
VTPGAPWPSGRTARRWHGRLVHSLVDVIAQPEQAPVSAGIAEIWESAPIEFDYDNDCAVCYMLEGRVTLTEGDTRLDFEPGDVIFVPQREGLKVSWDTPSYGTSST